MVITPSWHGIAVYSPGATYGPRTLTTYCFLWILRGGMHWRANGQEIDLAPGAVALSRPGIEESYRWDAQGLNSHGYICFTVEGLPRSRTSRWAWHREPEPRPLLIPVLEQALACLQHGDASLAGSALTHALRSFVAGPAPVRREPVRDHRLDRALEAAAAFWREHGLGGPSMAHLARATGISLPHLNRLFHTHFGTGPAAVLRALRLHRGAVMLAHSNLPLEDVALATGFTDAFHFSRHFRRRYQLAPGRWRRQVQAGEAVEPEVDAIRDLGESLWR